MLIFVLLVGLLFCVRMQSVLATCLKTIACTRLQSPYSQVRENTTMQDTTGVLTYKEALETYRSRIGKHVASPSATMLATLPKVCLK